MNNMTHENKPLDETTYIKPTLSELIEACPREIKLFDEEYNFCLHFDGDEWRAFYFLQVSSHEYEEGYTSYGDTPEEAVAKLLLELEN